MPAGVYDFEVEQGATFKRSFLYSNKDTGVPYNISGCKIRMQVRKAQQQPVIIEATTENGKFTITDGPGGKFDMTLSAVDTAALTSKEALYDIEIEFPDGPPATVNRILKGAFKVDPSITQIVSEPVLE